MILHVKEESVIVVNWASHRRVDKRVGLDELVKLLESSKKDNLENCLVPTLSDVVLEEES